MAPRWQRALVTGASSGLGAAFARILAAEGTDLVLVARRRDRLDDLAAELSKGSHVEVEVMVADLADAPALARVAERLGDDDRPVDLLINNAGQGTGGAFAASNLDAELAAVSLSVTAPVTLIHAALPVMLANGGAILNVSSVAAYLASPWGPIYSAGKMFEVVFSEAMAEQLHAEPVSMTVACPGFIATEFQQATAATGAPVARYPKFMEMSADQVARACLDGTERNAVRVVPGFGNRCVVGVASVLPAGVRRFVIGRLSRARGTT